MNTRILGVPLRVHIAPVGFEVARVVEPLVQTHADRVYLVTGDPSDRAKAYWDEILQRLRQDYALIDVVPEFTDPWSFPTLLKLYRRIVDTEMMNGNLVFVNLSTGTKVLSMVGLLSAMLWGTKPYYAQVTYGARAAPGGPVTESVTGILFPPIYRVRGPTDEELRAMQVLRSAGKPMRKGDLIQELRKQRMVPSKDEMKDPAAYGHLDRLLRPLIDRAFVEVKGERKTGTVQLTESGRDATLLFLPAAGAQGIT